MVKKIRVKTYINRLYCDECGEEMKRSSVVLMTYPPQYQYRCPQCGIETKDTKMYPEIEYEENEDED